MAKKIIAEGRRIMDDRRFESARDTDVSERRPWMARARMRSTGPMSGDAAADMDAARRALTGS